MNGSLSEFLAAREIWEIPLAASVLAGALLGALGVYVVLRRTVFVSAALTQLSTLGLVLALLVEEHVHIETEHATEQLAVAILFSVVGALVLGALRPRRLPAEAGVGAAWVAASALVVLGVSQLVHAAHDLGGMVFGNAVAVPLGDLVVIGAVAAVCTAVHALFAKELAFTSFDPETALALGMRVKVWDAVLFLTIGLAIPVTARALVKPGRDYLVYIRAPLPDQKDKNSAPVRFAANSFSLALALPPGKFVAEWLDTRTGSVARREHISYSGGTLSLTGPAFETDIALLIRKK